jgi:hypothetical protein
MACYITNYIPHTTWGLQQLTDSPTADGAPASLVICYICLFGIVRCVLFGAGAVVAWRVAL